MNENPLVLGDSVTADFELEFRPRPGYLLDQIYPDLAAAHPDVIGIIEPLLANYARSIRTLNREVAYSFDAVRSGFHRLIVHNPLIARVGAEFAYIQENYNFDDLIWRELGRGPKDFDGFVGKIKTGDHAPKKFAPDELLILASHFLQNAETVLPQILESSDYKFIVYPRHFDESSNQEVIEYYVEGGGSNREYGIKIMFGQHKLKPEITIGKIEVVDLSTRREIFVFDLGFYTNYERDRRYGLLVDEASQLGATLVANPDDTLSLDPKYTEAVLDEKRAQLMGPDRWATTALDNDSPEADAERVVRAFRVKIFFHEEPIDTANIYGRLFDEGDYGWDRITEVLEGIIRYLDEPIIGDAEAVKKEKKRRATIQTKLTKEMLVMMEADPYMVLLIGLRVPLFRVFPNLKDYSPEFFSELLKAEAFYYGEGIDPVFQRERTLETFLESRRLWLTERMAGGGYSGLKLFLNAFNNKTRSSDIHLTKEEVEFLFSRQNGDQFGLFSFEEDRSSAVDGRLHTSILFTKLVNSRLHPHLENLDIHLRKFAIDGHSEIRSKLINSPATALDFALSRLGQIVDSGSRNFALNILFSDGATIIPPKFQGEIIFYLYALGFIKPFGQIDNLRAPYWELEDFGVVDKLWHGGRGDKEQWSIITHRNEGLILQVISAWRKKSARQGKREKIIDINVTVGKLSTRYEAHLKSLYATSALYMFHPPTESHLSEWMTDQTDLIPKEIIPKRESKRR